MPGRVHPVLHRALAHTTQLTSFGKTSAPCRTHGEATGPRSRAVCWGEVAPGFRATVSSSHPRECWQTSARVPHPSAGVCHGVPTMPTPCEGLGTQRGAECGRQGPGWAESAMEMLRSCLESFPEPRCCLHPARTWLQLSGPETLRLLQPQRGQGPLTAPSATHGRREVLGRGIPVNGPGTGTPHSTPRHRNPPNEAASGRALLPPSTPSLQPDLRSTGCPSPEAPGAAGCSWTAELRGGVRTGSSCWSGPCCFRWASGVRHKCRDPAGDPHTAQLCRVSAPFHGGHLGDWGQ